MNLEELTPQEIAGLIDVIEDAQDAQGDAALEHRDVLVSVRAKLLTRECSDNDSKRLHRIELLLTALCRSHVTGIEGKWLTQQEQAELAELRK